MTSRNNNKNSINETSELDKKIEQADPLIKHAISEYRKEILRLQKQIVKEQISHESEKQYLLERLEQEKIQVNIISYENDI